MYARSDKTRVAGVHKPPADQPIVAAKDVSLPISHEERGPVLTISASIFCEATVAGAFALRGARTLLRRTDDDYYEWRYINVRRLFLMMADSIESQLQWTVHEPNNQAYWRDIERVVGSFLDRLWRQGIVGSGETGRKRLPSPL